jgi:hypothetical protein
MRERPARQPMTDGEREILFQMQQMQAKYFDLVHMCINQVGNLRLRIDELCQEVRELKAQIGKDRLF